MWWSERNCGSGSARECVLWLHLLPDDLLSSLNLTGRPDTELSGFITTSTVMKSARIRILDNLDGHTQNATFASTTDWIPLANLTQVYHQFNEPQQLLVDTGWNSFWILHFSIMARTIW